MKFQSASRRVYLTTGWQRTCKDVWRLHCILVYWGYCQWGNCYHCLHCDGLLPVWSLKAGVKWRFRGEALPLFDSKAKTWHAFLRCFRIISFHQISVLEMSWCVVMMSLSTPDRCITHDQCFSETPCSLYIFTQVSCCTTEHFVYGAASLPSERAAAHSVYFAGQ